LLILVGAMLFMGAAYAQQRSAQSLNSTGDSINANTVAIISGNINAAWLTIAYDLSAVLDDGDNLRVLPVIGKGGAQNVRDVRFLKGIDMGITVTSVLGNYRRTGELGKIDDKIVYITKLFNDEMHVLVHESSGITSIQQLRGKKVNFSDRGSATQVSSRDVFDRLGIKVEEVNMGQADAYEKIKSGEIAATIQFGGKPAPSIRKLTHADGFRLLPVPYSKELREDYLPASLANEDYPGVIDKGQHVETIAYGAVIIAYNWPKNTDRYRRLEKFVNAFFSKLPELKKPPRHPKWKEVNLAAELPGWKRFEAADEWLKQHRAETSDDARRERFDQFLSARGATGSFSVSTSNEERERLYRDFLKWDQARGNH
jgi:TRAP transporter TAXI family solute receptor